MIDDDNTDRIVYEVKSLDFTVSLIVSPSTKIYYLRITTNIGKVYIPITAVQNFVKYVKFIGELYGA